MQDDKPPAQPTTIWIFPLQLEEDRYYYVPHFTWRFPFTKSVRREYILFDRTAVTNLNINYAEFSRDLDQMPPIGNMIDLYPGLQGMVFEGSGDIGLSVLVHENCLPDWEDELSVQRFTQRMTDAGWTASPESGIIFGGH